MWNYRSDTDVRPSSNPSGCGMNLIHKNMSNLVGKRISQEELERLQDVIRSNAMVNKVITERGTQIGEDEYKYTADVSYDLNVKLGLTSATC